jgi:hypothetical protein
MSSWLALGAVRVGPQSKVISGPVYLSRWQTRSVCVSAPAPCMMANVKCNKLTILVYTVTDLALLLIMFVGLLRMSPDGVGTLSLASLLRKQVDVAVVGHGSHNSLTLVPSYEGRDLALACHRRCDLAEGDHTLSLMPILICYY